MNPWNKRLLGSGPTTQLWMNFDCLDANDWTQNGFSPQTVLLCYAMVGATVLNGNTSNLQKPQTQWQQWLTCRSYWLNSPLVLVKIRILARFSFGENPWKGRLDDCFFRDHEQNVTSVLAGSRLEPFKKHHFVTYFTLYDPEKHQAFELISRIIGKKPGGTRSNCECPVMFSHQKKHIMWLKQCHKPPIWEW
jgi:hypothetical protein